MDGCASEGGSVGAAAAFTEEADIALQANEEADIVQQWVGNALKITLASDESATGTARTGASRAGLVVAPDELAPTPLATQQPTSLATQQPTPSPPVEVNESNSSDEFPTTNFVVTIFMTSAFVLFAGEWAPRVASAASAASGNCVATAASGSKCSEVF
jgi:hypothetical protein